MTNIEKLTDVNVTPYDLLPPECDLPLPNKGRHTADVSFTDKWRTKVAHSLKDGNAQVFWYYIWIRPGGWVEFDIRIFLPDLKNDRDYWAIACTPKALVFVASILGKLDRQTVQNKIKTIVGEPDQDDSPMDEKDKLKKLSEALQDRGFWCPGSVFEHEPEITKLKDSKYDYRVELSRWNTSSASLVILNARWDKKQQRFILSAYKTGSVTREKHGEKMR